MAFLKELMNLQMTCFSHDELEEMMQWYILQRGDAKETGNGMITHYFDESRHLHFFHYLETKDENMEDGIWRVDVHYDSGRDSDSVIALEKDLDNYISSEDDRFDTVLPVTWKLGEKLVPVLLETANKNDLRNVSAGETIAANINMFAFDVDIINTKKDYNNKKKNVDLPEIGDFLPTGLIYSAMVAEDKEKRDTEFEKMLQMLVQDYRIMPFTFSQGIFKIKSFEKVETGAMTSLYDIVVDCEGQDLHVIAPVYLSALKNLKKGRYLDVSGMLMGMILPEEDIRHKQDDKNNLLQFKPAN
ncbi:MAG: hypothetical protein UDG94_06740 [Peptococcaceae bacterium]|nr:hypothetical protein [Peptococcaceae bacterium]